MWKNAKGVVKPLDATMAGYENENAVFIARTNFKDGVHPCKFVENFGCYVSYGRKEYSVTDFEYYTGSVKWVKCTNHQIPDGAIVAGHESDGKKALHRKNGVSEYAYYRKSRNSSCSGYLHSV